MNFRMIHENYNVADLNASIRFYEEALGLHEARRKTGEDFIPNKGRRNMSKELEKMTPELRAFIEEWKAKPGNLIMVLHRVQQTYGYIPREIAIETSEILGVPLAKIYGVITFYNFFRLRKAGKYNIQVCLGTACYLRGGDDVLKEFEKQLGVGLNATTPDGMFSVEAVRCLGCCGLAPVAVVNGEVHGKLSTKDVENIIAKYCAEG